MSRAAYDLVASLPAAFSLVPVRLRNPTPHTGVGWSIFEASPAGDSTVRRFGTESQVRTGPRKTLARRIIPAPRLGINPDGIPYCNCTINDIYRALFRLAFSVFGQLYIKTGRSRIQRVLSDVCTRYLVLYATAGSPTAA